MKWLRKVQCVEEVDETEPLFNNGKAPVDSSNRDGRTSIKVMLNQYSYDQGYWHPALAHKGCYDSDDIVLQKNKKHVELVEGEMILNRLLQFGKTNKGCTWK
eukprot:309998-Amphidinium_carterae.3